MGAKSAKKYSHVGTVEAFRRWRVGTNVKAKRATSCAPPMEVLDFLHLWTKACKEKGRGEKGRGGRRGSGGSAVGGRGRHSQRSRLVHPAKTRQDSVVDKEGHLQPAMIGLELEGQGPGPGPASSPRALRMAALQWRPRRTPARGCSRALISRV